MSDSFSLSRSRYVSSDSSLREEILGHTGSDEATSGIMRSLDRFGDDSTILRYDITPKKHRPTNRNALAVAWSVRAVRR